MVFYFTYTFIFATGFPVFLRSTHVCVRVLLQVQAFEALLNLCIGTLVAATIAYRAAQIDCHVAGVVAIVASIYIP